MKSFFTGICLFYSQAISSYIKYSYVMRKIWEDILIEKESPFWA